jgi:transcriptional regulator with XRE-family HTH domain
MDDTFGGRLRAIRREQHKSQEATAHRAGLSVAHYNRLEHNLHSPTLDTVQRLAAALDVDLDTLAGKSDKTGQDSHSYPDDHNNFPAAS